MPDNIPDDEFGPDPIDGAYAEAEAMLGDDAARAARRARVLAAVAAAPAIEAAPVAVRRAPGWRQGGWLAAACVAGLGLFVVAGIYGPPTSQPKITVTSLTPPAPPPATSTAPTAQTAPVPAAAAPAPPRTAPATRPAAPPSPPTPSAAPSDRPEAFGARRDSGPAAATAEEAPLAPPSPPPPPAPVERPAPPPPAAAPPALMAAPSPRAAGAAEMRGSSSDALEASGMARANALPPPDRGARLRAAAAAGRAADVEALLGQGASVDAPDANGDTALMRSTFADHPAIAALLRRHGANPDRRNHAGDSARAMAARSGDAALIDAVGGTP
jgi:hypothetical protein